MALNNNIVQNRTTSCPGRWIRRRLFNGQMYYVEGYGGVGKSFAFANAAFSVPATTTSPDGFAFAGSTPMISANNGSNGIVWDVDRGTNQLAHIAPTRMPPSFVPVLRPPIIVTRWGRR